MPGLIKIGHTKTSVEERLAQLNSTSVPVPFNLSASFHVLNPSEIEKSIHKALQPYRYNKSREFFNISARDAISEVIGIITTDLVETMTTFVQPDKAKSAHVLDDGTISVLKSLADSNRRRGYEACQLTNVTNESELEIENRLANLRELGLVDEKKTRENWRGSTWKITSKGVKYIFDNALVEDYMIETFR